MPLTLGIVSDYMIKYGTFSFTNQHVCLTSIPDIDNSPQINFQNYNIAKADGMGNSEYTLQQKNITFTGWIRTPTKEQTQEIMDNIKKSCYKPGQKLFFKRLDGKEIYTIAYCTNLYFDRSTTNINYVPFNITFTTLEPFWYAKEKSQLQIPTQSTNVDGSIIYTAGIYKAMPSLYISFTTATNVDEIVFTLGDQTITLNETVSDGDFVAIDGRDQDILINGIGGRDYLGSFPELPVGETPFSVDINGTRTADIYIQWEDTYV